MKKTLIFSLLAVVGVSLIGASLASAQSSQGLSRHFSKHFEAKPGFDMQLETKAEILGLSQADLEAKLAEGLNFREIANQQGLNKDQLRDQLHNLQIERILNLLDEYVADSKLTQDQAIQIKAKLDMAVAEGNYRFIRHLVHWIKFAGELFK